MAKVLLIESDQALAASLTQQFRAAGVEVSLTDDGNEAIRLARDEQPKLIVLCVELSRGSGYSVCNKLKKDPALAAIPLILTSSQATDETFEQHKKLRTRAEAYLKKPYPPAQLMKIAGEYVSLSSAPAPAAGDDFEVSLDDGVLEAENKGGDDLLDVSLDDGLDEAMTTVAVSKSAPKSPARAAPAASEDHGFGGMATQVLLSDAEGERLRTEIRQLRQKVTRLEQTLQEKELEFNDRLLEESSRGRDAAELKKKIAQVERELAKYQQLTEKANAELEKARQELKQARQDVEQAEQERGVLSEKIGQLVDKVKSLAAERDTLQKELQSHAKSRSDLDIELQHAAKVRDKARKAVDIAMQLLDETGLSH